MRLIRTTAKTWRFALVERERDFLVAVLKAYPVAPRDLQSLSRYSMEHLSEEDEALLADALAEQRSGNRDLVQRWLKSPTRFKMKGEKWEFSLAKTDFNWMLQVLNDVRVGSWVLLESPEDVQDPFELMQKHPAAFFQMEAAGLFEMQFLQTIYSDPSDENET